MSNRPIIITSIPRDDDPQDDDPQDDDDSFTEFLPTVPRIKQKRICEYNYVTYPTPISTSRSQWHNAYLSQLIDINNIVANTMNERYPKNKIKWVENKKIFHNLSRLLYHCSSKHISPYLESKEVELDNKDGES
jgi:hypothetical protein